MCNAAAVITLNEGFSTLAHGLYYAATDWLVICLLAYVKKYTGLLNGRKAMEVLIRAGAAVDTCSMILNVFFHQTFRCELTDNEAWGRFYAPANQTFVYTLHLLYVYGTVLVVGLVLVIKILRTIRLYRRKYEMILWSFVCILAVNIGYRFIDIPIDISPILYMFLAVAVAYFTLFYVPKGIVAKLLSFSIDDMESSILCFDMEGKCVYLNERADRLFHIDGDIAKIEKYFAMWKNGRGNEELKECVWREKHDANGQVCHFEARFKPLLNNAGHYIGGFFAIEDRTEEVQRLEQQRYSNMA